MILQALQPGNLDSSLWLEVAICPLLLLVEQEFVVASE